MNEKGDVLGTIYESGGFSSSAVVWSKGSLKVLPKPVGVTYVSPNGINERGQIAGNYQYGTIDPATGFIEFHVTAFIQHYDGTIREIRPESLSASAVSAQDINNFGHVLFNADLADGTSAWFISRGGSSVPVKGLGEAGFFCRKMNDWGQVAGESYGDDTVSAWGFISSHGYATPLISPFGGQQSYAFGLNNLGQATGAGFFPVDQGSVSYQAYIYRFGIMQPIPALGTYSQGSSINLFGHVVGSYADSDGMGRGFIYINGRTLDLSEHLKKAKGWRITGALAINDAGQILGSGDGPDGYGHYVLLTPEP